VELRLLGPIEVRLEDRPIELGPRKQRALLAMLALQVGRTVTADRLVEGLWGEEPPASAPKMVQLYVSHLRPLLEGSGARIATRNGGYELQLCGDEVDVVRFERLLDQSRAREALALWRGDALADVAGEPFAAAEIRRLDDLRLRAAESAIELDLAAGRHAEVIGELERLVAAEPLREHLHAQRMLALYRSGRQAEALEAYRDARSALVEQIGVEPGTELRSLQDAILAQDPALDVQDAADAELATPPPPPARRPTQLVLVAAAILVVAGLTAYGTIRVLEPDSLAGIDENAVGLIDPDGPRITDQYGVGKSPSAIVGGGGSVWIANAADGTVTRIDRDRERPISFIPVGESPAALAFGGGSLWVADSDSRKVWQVDPGSNEVVKSIEVGNAPRALAVAAGAVWVASGVDGRLQRIDVARRRAAPPIAVGANPSAIAAGAGALWVASEEAGTVTRIAPRTGSVVETIRVGPGPSALAVGEGGVWVVNRHVGTLTRIDPATNAPMDVVHIGSDPTAVAVGGGAVWVAGGEEGVVTRVDPEHPADIEKLKTGNSPAAIAVAGGSVWAAADAPQAAHRGGTLRVLLPDDASNVPIDPLHHRSYETPHVAQLSSLTHDGLVAYRRLEGAAAATLVGALATTAPLPSPDGKTYVFTLRRGLRFSDGRPVRPADFRASMERFLQVTRHRPEAAGFPPLYASIVGARRCSAGRTRCDLSRGIETDPQARTITVHLTRRDPDFLHKLTMAWAFVVPADSPVRTTTGPTPPGTGPYRAAAWDRRRGGLLVRNSYFRSGAARSRPDGFADRIAVEVRSHKTAEAQIADVQSGAADLAVIANPFISFVTADRLRALRARSPGRLYSAPAPTSDYMFLNVSRRPFDKTEVRQAVNFATDRAHLVALTGGSEVGTPACQVLPLAFPAYEPYCPYTARPSTGGSWTAPDMDRARGLVATSGRAGDRVVVWSAGYMRPIGQYFTRLLNQLGFRATLHVPADKDYGAIYDPGTQAQAGTAQWGADYLAPSTFIQPPFTCAPRDRYSNNLSKLCDGTLERRIRRALATPPAEAAGAWAAADHRLSDVAAAVPLTNRRSVVLVSKRVGNVKTHGQFFTLLDQMWVR
jgi:ABC-type transport system substrate-binding protein/DNA-binding SARP family transcriptional activator/sugar lactone lactonase YvrE